MELSLWTSIIGIILFSTLMYFGFKYANGKWEVTESKKSEYLIWTNKNGSRIKIAIVTISVIYGILMLIQITKAF